MFQDFKPVLKILFRFIIIYLLLLFAYQIYLNFYKTEAADPFTRIIAEQTGFFLNKLGYETHLVDDTKAETINFYVNKIWATRMIEGCNAVSIMIMFLAFIFAFFKGKKTFWFVGIGLVILYILNVFRIVWLNIIVVDYSEYTKIAHDYFFPAIIYGGVVILWLIWIKFFALKEETKTLVDENL